MSHFNKHSEETKRKISLKLLGRKPGHTQKHSDAYKLKMREITKERWRIKKQFASLPYLTPSEYGKIYRAKISLEKKRLYSQTRRHNRRARQKLAKGKFTSKDWREILEKYNYKCNVCEGKEPFMGQFYEFLTVDHIIPLFRGGSNNKDNIQPLCGSCNSRKGNRFDSAIL